MKTKNLLLAVSLLLTANYLLPSIVFAQNLQWANAMGGTGDDVGNSIVTDALGNVYVTGHFGGTADFDPGAGIFNLTSVGGDDIFISKLDPAGNFLWAKAMGGTGTDWGTGIALDASGNVYTIGLFQVTVDFDPDTGAYNLTSAGNQDIFISKLDASGNFIWARAIGGIVDDQGAKIAIDVLGNVYTTGIFGDTVDFDTGAGTFNLISAGGFDIFISKLDASGNFIWAKAMGGSGNDVGYSIAADASSNIYSTGFFVGTGDFNPGAGVLNLTSVGGEDIFISKLDASGNFVWAKAIGGTSNDRGRRIAVNPSGNVYSTGFFNDTTDFDPGAATFNLFSTLDSQDIFICKLDTLGNFAWAKAMGGTATDAGISIALDASDNIYTTGSFQLTSDFDPGAGTFNLTSAGANDIFISKLDASGNFIWAKAMGGTTGDAGFFIAIDASDNVYATGNFSGTADFDPSSGTFNITSAGVNDIFIAKLCQSNSFTQNLSICNGNSITVGSNTYTTSGTYLDTLTAVNSCDSIVTTNLTVNPLPIADAGSDVSICNGSGTTLNASGGSIYTWSPSAGLSSMTIPNPIANPGSTTVYTVTVIDTNSCMANDSVLVTVNPSPTVNAGSDQTICSDSMATLSGSFGGSASSATWSTSGAGSFDITGSLTAVYTPSAADIASGSVTLTLTTNDPDGAGPCLAVTDNLMLNLKPNATFSQNPTICQGQSITVGSNTYTTSGIYLDTLTTTNSCDSFITTILTVNPTYSDTINVTICNGQSITVGSNTYTTSGTYLDTLTTANSCDSFVTTILTVNPSSSFSQSPTICNGQSVTVGSSTYTVSGTYIDTIIGAAANGCDSIVTTNLTVNSLPNVFITPNNSTTFCNGDSVTLTAAGGNIYLWSTGDTTVSIVVKTSSYPSVLVTDSNSCQNGDTIAIIVNPLPVPDFNFSVNGLTVTFTDTSTNADSYFWEAGDGNTSALQNPVHTYSSADTFMVKLIVTSIDGCIDSITKTIITVNPIYQLSGIVYRQVITNVITAGKVYLIKYENTGTAMQKVDSTNINTDGTYQFNTVLMDSFLLLAEPDQATNPNVFSTYYPSNSLWTNATVIVPTGNMTGLDIGVKENASATGPGNINGKVVKGNAFGKVMTVGDPIKDINVTLLKASDNTGVRFTVTDSLGKFSFNTLPIDSYYLWVDVTGIPVDTSVLNMTFNITATDTAFNSIIVAVDSTLIYTNDTLTALKTLDAQISYFQIYPNPNSGNFAVEICCNQSGKIEIILTNILGQQMLLMQDNYSSGTFRKQIDIHELPSGIYFLNVRSNENMVRKIMKN